ncbi:MAG: transcriptional regulator NrdR [Cyanobacteria bacterium J06642_12]
MKCPKCSSRNIRVLESRSAEAGQSVRRRRECMECKFRFTTYERIEFVPIMTIKQDGSRESFDRNKILKGVMRACEKTDVSVKAMEALVEGLEETLQLADKQEITTREIGEMVLQRLQDLSEVAYVRFASVYRQFRGVRDFMDELGTLVDNKDAIASEHNLEPSNLDGDSAPSSSDRASVSL